MHISVFEKDPILNLDRLLASNLREDAVERFLHNRHDRLEEGHHERFARFLAARCSSVRVISYSIVIVGI